MHLALDPPAAASLSCGLRPPEAPPRPHMSYAPLADGGAINSGDEEAAMERGTEEVDVTFAGLGFAIEDKTILSNVNG